MNIESLRFYCLSLPGVKESFPFDEENLVFKVLGKMFALLPLDTPDHIVLKAHPEYSRQLRAEYAGITGAWHFNKAYWNDVSIHEDVPEDLVLRLIRHSYAEVLHGLPKKWQVKFFSDQLPSTFYYEHFNTTDSVMDRLKLPEYAKLCEEFVLLEADYQKKGRGQRGTSWESSSAKNLLFGLLLRPVFLPAAEQFLLSEVMSLAIAESLSAYVDGISIKWPNDIYWRDEKICGMLLEHDLCGGRISQTIVGPGINVNQATFLGDAPNPTSLLRILGWEVNRFLLLRDIMDRFLSLYEELKEGKYREIDEKYQVWLYRKEAVHLYEDAQGRFEGTLRRVQPDGRLVIEDREGRERVYAFKEVKFVI